jgi:hypothetical protein
MNRIVGLTMIAGCAIAAGAAVRMMRGHRTPQPQPTQTEIDRFENEGGHAVPI